MTKKQMSLYGSVSLIIGIMGGVVSTAFSAGEEKQRINDALVRNTSAIEAMKNSDVSHEAAVKREMDRYAEIIASQVIHLQDSIRMLTVMVNDLRTDVQVIKALMERMEEDLKHKTESA